VDPPPPDPHPVTRALRAFLEDRPEEAIDILRVYEPRDQDVLLALLPIIARVEKSGLLTSRMTREEALTFLEVLRSLTADASRSAPLVVGRAAFARDVLGFGRVEELPANQFRAGDRIGVYLEIDNLADRRADDGRYVTRLASTLQIRGGDRILWSQPVQSKPDRSRSPRHDHFTFIRFQVPRELEPGAYTLHVRITDQDTNRTVEKVLEFRVLHLTAKR
jgi:hypothetical protein